jgi:serine/threonine protein kinase
VPLVREADPTGRRCKHALRAASDPRSTITRDDQVKILDFGLAKPLEMGGTDMTQGVGLATNTGLVLGTFGYMAPEQVRGLPVDHRADVFAFGAVLYEMLTGERAFQGETAADTMSAILTQDPPDLDGSRLAISASLDRIVRRCLERVPELRFQSATDLAFALETLSTITTSPGSLSTAPAAPPSRQRARWQPWTFAAIGVSAGLALGLLLTRGKSGDPPWSAFTRISEAAGEETTPALSPDGGIVLYAASVDGQWDIYSQRVGGRNPTPIVNDPQRDERGPSFSQFRALAGRQSPPRVFCQRRH